MGEGRESWSMSQSGSGREAWGGLGLGQKRLTKDETRRKKEKTGSSRFARPTGVGSRATRKESEVLRVAGQTERARVVRAQRWEREAPK